MIVNEFGDVGIDGQLTTPTAETVIEINNGCICCKVRGDLIAALGQLVGIGPFVRSRRDRDERARRSGAGHPVVRARRSAARTLRARRHRDGGGRPPLADAARRMTRRASRSRLPMCCCSTRSISWRASGIDLRRDRDPPPQSARPHSSHPRLRGRAREVLDVGRVRSQESARRSIPALLDEHEHEHDDRHRLRRDPLDAAPGRREVNRWLNKLVAATRPRPPAH